MQLCPVIENMGNLTQYRYTTLSLHILSDPPAEVTIDEYSTSLHFTWIAICTASCDFPADASPVIYMVIILP